MACLIIQFAEPRGYRRKQKSKRGRRLVQGRNYVHITVDGRALCNRRRWLPTTETTKSVASCPGCIVQATKAVS